MGGPKLSARADSAEEEELNANKNQEAAAAEHKKDVDIEESQKESPSVGSKGKETQAGIPRKKRLRWADMVEEEENNSQEKQDAEDEENKKGKESEKTPEAASSEHGEEVTEMNDPSPTPPSGDDNPPPPGPKETISTEARRDLPSQQEIDEKVDQLGEIASVIKEKRSSRLKMISDLMDERKRLEDENSRFATELEAARLKQDELKETLETLRKKDQLQESSRAAEEDSRLRYEQKVRRLQSEVLSVAEKISESVRCHAALQGQNINMFKALQAKQQEIYGIWDKPGSGKTKEFEDVKGLANRTKRRNEKLATYEQEAIEQNKTLEKSRQEIEAKNQEIKRLDTIHRGVRALYNHDYADLLKRSAEIKASVEEAAGNLDKGVAVLEDKVWICHPSGEERVSKLLQQVQMMKPQRSEVEIKDVR